MVCLPGVRIEHVTERVDQIMGRGNGGSILVHIGTNNADKEGTTSIEVSQSHDILTSHMFVTPYWRSSQLLPGVLSYGTEVVKVFI